MIKQKNLIYTLIKVVFHQKCHNIHSYNIHTAYKQHTYIVNRAYLQYIQQRHHRCTKWQKLHIFVLCIAGKMTNPLWAKNFCKARNPSKARSFRRTKSSHRASSFRKTRVGDCTLFFVILPAIPFPFSPIRIGPFVQVWLDIFYCSQLFS